MKYNLEVLKQQQGILTSFVQHLAYARGVRAAIETFTVHSQFWAATASAHLGYATVEWCKVFGTNRETTQWKKIFTAAAGTQAIDDFRRALLVHAGLDDPQWKECHEKILALRNTFVAHHDLKNPFRAPTPHFDAALLITYAYQARVKPLYQEAFLEQSLPETWAEPRDIFIAQYEIWKAEALAIVSPQ